MSNESGRQQSMLDALEAEGLPASQVWHAYWDSLDIAAGPFNSRMLEWLQTDEPTIVNLPSAMVAYAVSLGFDRWNSVNEVETA